MKKHQNIGFLIEARVFVVKIPTDEKHVNDGKKSEEEKEAVDF